MSITHDCLHAPLSIKTPTSIFIFTQLILGLLHLLCGNTVRLPNIQQQSEPILIYQFYQTKEPATPLKYLHYQENQPNPEHCQQFLAKSQLYNICKIDSSSFPQTGHMASYTTFRYISQCFVGKVFDPALQSRFTIFGNA